MIRFSSLAAMLLLVASACTVLPEREPVTLYQLPVSGIQAADSRLEVGGLRIARPASSDALGGNRLMVLRDDHRYEAFPEARWSASIPVLWRDWLLDAFWRDARIEQVSADNERLAAQIELSGTLRALHMEYVDGQMVARVQYDARLIQSRGREIIASRRFEASEPVSDESAPASSVRALGVAADRLAAELLDWVGEQLDGV